MRTRAVRVVYERGIRDDAHNDNDNVAGNHDDWDAS